MVRMQSVDLKMRYRLFFIIIHTLCIYIGRKFDKTRTFCLSELGDRVKHNCFLEKCIKLEMLETLKGTKE